MLTNLNFLHTGRVVKQGIDISLWNTLFATLNHTLLCLLLWAQWKQGLFSSAPTGVDVVWRPAISIRVVVQLLLSFGGPGEGSKPVGHMWFIMPVIGFDFAFSAFSLCLIKGRRHWAGGYHKGKQRRRKDWHGSSKWGCMAISDLGKVGKVNLCRYLSFYN